MAAKEITKIITKPANRWRSLYFNKINKVPGVFIFVIDSYYILYNIIQLNKICYLKI